MERLARERLGCPLHEARSGLMRAWLAILSARHPNVVWLPAERHVGDAKPGVLEPTYLLEPDGYVKKSIFTSAGSA